VLKLFRLKTKVYTRPDRNQEEDQWIILHKVLSSLSHFDTESYPPEKILPAINKLLQRGILIDNAKTFLLKIIKWGEEPAEFLSQIYSSYCDESIKSNCLDFGNLIVQTITLLQNKPFIQKFLHRIYYHVCVDEFQDTNQAQYDLLQLLINPERRNLFVVANDQIIYQWNGASPERLTALQKSYNLTIIQLPENYRCPPEIIYLANKLISRNPGRHPAKQALLAHKPASDSYPICVKEFLTFEAEAKWIAHDIEKRSDRSGCVVLARSKRLLESIVKELTQLEVPAYLHSRKNEFESAPLIWLHALLRLANTRQDKKQFYRVYKAFYQLEGIKIEPEVVESLATTRDDDYLRAWHTLVSDRNEVSEQVKQILVKSVPKLMDKLDFSDLVEKAFKWFDILRNNDQQAEKFIDYEEEKKTWQEMQTEIERQYGREQVTLHLLLQEMDLRSKNPLPPQGAVPCFTIHASNGMEFKHVYLAGLVEEQFPSWQAIKKGDESFEMQEDRRTCFVAITRTQETLTLTYAKNVFGWNKQPSRFLEEMDLIEKN
jgi:DNA helicase-2/ATP-dependent DNA helicase PcrA